MEIHPATSLRDRRTMNNAEPIAIPWQTYDCTATSVGTGYALPAIAL
jgi:hypothetical protein